MEEINNMERLENLREKIRTKTTTVSIIGAAVGTVILCIIIYTKEFKFLMFAAMSTFVIFVVLHRILTYKEMNEFKKIYKNIVVLETLKKTFTITEFNPDAGIPRSEIYETEMMSTGDRYHSNDYIVGKYKNINFKCADVHIETESEDSDGNNTYLTMFRGQWMIFDFNKTFRANIQICEKLFAGAKRGGLFSKTKYYRVNLEDVEFNNQFRVYAQNEQEAFYILTPGMMERIKKLNAQIPGKMLFCLKDNKLHIGLHNSKDLFEPNVYKKVDINEDKQKILNEMKIITSFVDVLNLENDLFKKEK